MKVSRNSSVVSAARRGRPRVCEQYSTVTTYLPADLHDELVQLAKRRDVSVSKVVREIVSGVIVLQNK